MLFNKTSIKNIIKKKEKYFKSLFSLTYELLNIMLELIFLLLNDEKSDVDENSKFFFK